MESQSHHLNPFGPCGNELAKAKRRVPSIFKNADSGDLSS
jgi:hypothetical protein